MDTGSVMSYGVVSRAGRSSEGAQPSTESFDSDAESIARGAVQKLASSPHLSHVTLASELRDGGEVGYFKNESLYQRLASEAGFELAVNVMADRRGYLHCLQMCRKSNEARRLSNTSRLVSDAV